MLLLLTMLIFLLVLVHIFPAVDLTAAPDALVSQRFVTIKILAWSNRDR
jgi:hypothetical protein